GKNCKSFHDETSALSNKYFQGNRIIHKGFLCTLCGSTAAYMLHSVIILCSSCFSATPCARLYSFHNHAPSVHRTSVQPASPADTPVRNSRLHNHVNIRTLFRTPVPSSTWSGRCGYAAEPAGLRFSGLQPERS